jgi:collagenase-like PrtC family protease
LLEKYHRTGNAVIITNDGLARWIREDFANYKIEASVIKNIDSYAEIDNAFELYDTVVLPMRLNQDEAFLTKIHDKGRITLFANAGCALTCPSKICYPSISRLNKYRGGEFRCSQTLKYRELHGMVDFDLENLCVLGFSRFKLLRAKSATIAGLRGVTGF